MWSTYSAGSSRHESGQTSGMLVRTASRTASRTVGRLSHGVLPAPSQSAQSLGWGASRMLRWRTPLQTPARPRATSRGPPHRMTSCVGVGDQPTQQAAMSSTTTHGYGSPTWDGGNRCHRLVGLAERCLRPFRGVPTTPVVRGGWGTRRQGRLGADPAGGGRRGVVGPPLHGHRHPATPSQSPSEGRPGWRRPPPSAGPPRPRQVAPVFSYSASPSSPPRRRTWWGAPGDLRRRRSTEPEMCGAEPDRLTPNLSRQGSRDVGRSLLGMHRPCDARSRRPTQ
mmetsp:Transcript_21601/g.64364  ORF Transcript_21601/g.64364 Transcript_21601/m.64364 type:complete len:281 (+) Transcript_21601:1285-2127(+)